MKQIKTINKFALLLLMLVGAGTTAWAENKTMTVDFERIPNSMNYYGWSFNNFGLGADEITPHLGENYGKTNMTSTAYIMTNKKVDPVSLTCYVSKINSNTSLSNWYIQVSANGSDWTDVNSTSSTDMTEGDWKVFSADLSSYSDVYVRVYYSGATAVRCIDDLTLTVENSGDTSVTYTRATEVVPGRYYILTDGSNIAMGDQNTNNRSVKTITINGGIITFDSNAGVCELFLGLDTETGFFTLYDADNGYLYASSSDYNYLKSKIALDANGKWTIKFNDNGSAVIKSQGSNSRNTLSCNNNSTCFSCYTKAPKDTYLYERVGDIGSQDFTVNINSACTDGTKYYGTFSAPFAFTVPSDVTVSEVGVNNGKLQVEDYDVGTVIPSNTGVMISSETAGDKTFTSAKGGISVMGEDNNLRPTVWGITALEMASVDPSCQYYRLTMHNGTIIGYWWGAEAGASFDYVTPNRAYLAVPTNGARQSFAFDDDANAIGDVNVEATGDDRCFDLQGRSVAQPQKGLYIVNGKKVVR